MLELLFFYSVGNTVGYLLRDVCWLIRGCIYYYFYIANYKLITGPII